MMSDEQIKALAVGFDLLGQLRSREDAEGHVTALLIALYGAARRAELELEETLERVRNTFELFASTPHLVHVLPRSKSKGQS